MFKIIGADQKEYGPIGVEQIRQWIRDGRLNGQTPAQRAGEGEWQPLSAFAEFADLFQATTPSPGAAAPAYAPAALASGPIPTGSREAALSAVKGPAIALIIVASIGIAFYLLLVLFNLSGGLDEIYRRMAERSPELRDALMKNQGGRGVLTSLLAVALNAFVLVGAIKMLRLKSHTLAFIACIVAMIPCSCCCVLGIPFGIWGLVVLNKADVKSQFS